MASEIAKRESVRVQGLVIPAAWGPRGEITGVMIASFDDTDYLVGGEMEGRLLSHVRQVVDAVGYLQVKGDGERFLDVRSAKFPPDDPA